MRVLNQHLRLSRRRASLFFEMQKSMTTFPLTEQNSTDAQSLPGEITTGEKSQDRERGGIDGKSTTGESSDPTANSADSAGQGDARQDTVHADGQADNSIRSKPD